MKIYLDVCCLNRPFDNQRNLRIRLEAEAVKTILTLCEQDPWQLLNSQVIEFEIGKQPIELVKRGTIMMTMPTTDLEVRLLGLQALNKELGHIDTLRFMQQFSRGEGNYVNDRHEWQQHYTVDTLVEAIKQAEKEPV